MEFWMRFTPSTHRSIFWARSDLTNTNRFNIFVEPNGSLGIDYLEPNGVLHGIAYSAPLLTDTWTHIALTRVGNFYAFYIMET